MKENSLNLTVTVLPLIPPFQTEMLSFGGSPLCLYVCQVYACMYVCVCLCMHNSYGGILITLPKIFLLESAQAQIRKRGIKTITGLGRHYRQLDTSGTGLLLQHDLERGLLRFHIDLQPQVCTEIF